MGKKVLFLVLIVLLILPVSVFAFDLIGLRVGPTAMLNTPIDPEMIPEDFFENLTAEDFSFGVNARFNLTVLEMNVLALIEPILESNELVGAYVQANLGAGVSIALMDMVKLGIFAGPTISFAIFDGEFFPIDLPMDEDELFASTLFLRMAADVMLGGLSVGATYIVDTRTNLNNIFDEGFEFRTLFDNMIGKAGVSVLFELF